MKLLTTVLADCGSTSRELGRGVHAGVSGGARGGRDQVGAQGRSDCHVGLAGCMRKTRWEGRAECGQRRARPGGKGARTVG